jgi:hypothetical protein
MGSSNSMKVGGLLAVGAIALLAGCNMTGANSVVGKEACASAETTTGIKSALFRKSREGNPRSEARISELEQGSVAKVEQPVVDQIDATAEKTTCSGTLILSFPPGSKTSKGIDEQQKARIRYSIQPAADGNGKVYEVYGGEELASLIGGKRQAVATTAKPAEQSQVGPKRTGLYYIRGLNPRGDNWLALKTEPNLQSPRIAQLGPDTLLVSDGTRVGQWLKVETLDGRYGWVAARFTACCK